MGVSYAVTCVCGQRFSVGEGQVNRHVACPACSRALIPVAAVAASTPAAGTSGSAVPAAGGGEATKRCAFCGEVILAVARKCRFCGEYLDRRPPEEMGAAGAGGEKEKEPEAVFELAVSQWDNFFRYLICAGVVTVAGVVLFGEKWPWHWLVEPFAMNVFLVMLGVVAITAAFFWMAGRASRCTIWPNRIETETGIFSKQVESLEMFRVTDVHLRQNVLQRLLGVGSVEIRSSDEATPELELYMIPRARKVYRYVLEQVPKADKARGVVRVER